METRYIDTPEALESWVADMQGRPWVALDTEFVRERTFYPRLCLVQMATDDRAACIDPLEVTNLAPLRPLLSDPATTKILHAARQDMEVLEQTLGRVPTPIFDTQVAAALLGHGDQTGLETLLRELCGVQLKKSQTRSDWCRRPLSPEQIRYAIDDVRYLGAIYERLHTALAEAGRLEWLTAELKALTESAEDPGTDETAWQAVKGAGRLQPHELAVLRELARWREAQARRRDRPRRWILTDETLVAIARARPEDPQSLARIRGLDQEHRHRYGDELLETVASGLRCPAEDRPAPPQGRMLDPAEEPLVDIVLGLVKAAAARHRIAPTVLATRKEVERVVAGVPNRPLLKGWRRELVGAAIEHFLAGHAAVRVTDSGAICQEDPC